MDNIKAIEIIEDIDNGVYSEKRFYFCMATFSRYRHSLETSRRLWAQSA